MQKRINRKCDESFKKDSEDIKTVKEFAYLGSIFNSNGDCSQDIRRRLSLGRAAMEDYSTQQGYHLEWKGR